MFSQTKETQYKHVNMSVNSSWLMKLFLWTLMLKITFWPLPLLFWIFTVLSPFLPWSLLHSPLDGTKEQVHLFHLMNMYCADITVVLISWTSREQRKKIYICILFYFILLKRQPTVLICVYMFGLMTFLLHHDTDKPQLNGSQSPDPITVTEGEPLQLDCSAVGNPEPSYIWSSPSSNSCSSVESVFMIVSVTPADEGQYTCIVRNDVGTTSVEFNVTVTGEFRLLTVLFVFIHFNLWFYSF